MLNWVKIPYKHLHVDCQNLNFTNTCTNWELFRQIATLYTIQIVCAYAWLCQIMYMYMYIQCVHELYLVHVLLYRILVVPACFFLLTLPPLFWTTVPIPSLFLLPSPQSTPMSLAHTQIINCCRVWGYRFMVHSEWQQSTHCLPCQRPSLASLPMWADPTSCRGSLEAWARTLPSQVGVHVGVYLL